jgi:hypothetical protein
VIQSQSATTNEATIRLDGDQALVLFEWLASKRDEDETAEVTAQASVFDDMLAQLEKQLSEPFAANYADLLKEARKRLNLPRAAG